MKASWIGALVLMGTTGWLCRLPVRAEYAEIEVLEYSGMARNHWPVHLGVAIPAETSLETLWLGRVVHDAADTK